MSYCRFQNTYRDLVDCYTNMEDDLSSREKEARADLIALCKQIAEEYDGFDFTENNEEE